MEQTYAPGMRVDIRGEEWVVRKVESNSRGTQTMHVEGLSGLVKEKDAIFLSELEEIKIIDPAETRLMIDKSPNFRQSKLYIESLLRKKAATGNNITGLNTPKTSGFFTSGEKKASTFCFNFSLEAYSLIKSNHLSSTATKRVVRSLWL